MSVQTGDAKIIDLAWHGRYLCFNCVKEKAMDTRANLSIALAFGSTDDALNCSKKISSLFSIVCHGKGTELFYCSTKVLTNLPVELLKKVYGLPITFVVVQFTGTGVGTATGKGAPDETHVVGGTCVNVGNPPVDEIPGSCERTTGFCPTVLDGRVAPAP